MNEPTAPRETLATIDPSGRIDVLLYRLARHFVKQVEPRANNLPLWDKGVGEFVEAGIQELGVPARKFTVVDVCRALGVLPARTRGRR